MPPVCSPSPQPLPLLSPVLPKEPFWTLLLQTVVPFVSTHLFPLEADRKVMAPHVCWHGVDCLCSLAHCFVSASTWFPALLLTAMLLLLLHIWNLWLVVSTHPRSAHQSMLVGTLPNICFGESEWLWNARQTWAVCWFVQEQRSD